MIHGDLPHLDPTVCTGCGDCVVVCPENCLALAGPLPFLPFLPRPADCVSCGICVAICPVNALEMHKRMKDDIRRMKDEG